jgi:hypothetical protein
MLHLASIPEFLDARIVLIGGLALCWSFPEHIRDTNDVDFIIDAPKSVKTSLLKLPNTPFLDFPDGLRYTLPGGVLIRVDFIPAWQVPYMPDSAVAVRSVTPGAVPCLTRDEQIIFLAWTCGLRRNKDYQARDNVDLTFLLGLGNGQLQLPMHAQGLRADWESDPEGLDERNRNRLR